MCGQALSHCVSCTLDDIVADWNEHRRPLHDIHLLVDGRLKERQFHSYCIYINAFNYLLYHYTVLKKNASK